MATLGAAARAPLSRAAAEPVDLRFALECAGSAARHGRPDARAADAGRGAARRLVRERHAEGRARCARRARCAAGTALGRHCLPPAASARRQPARRFSPAALDLRRSSLDGRSTIRARASVARIDVRAGARHRVSCSTGGEPLPAIACACGCDPRRTLARARRARLARSAICCARAPYPRRAASQPDGPARARARRPIGRR